MSTKILHVVNVFFVLPYFLGDQFLYLKDKGYDLHFICSPSEHLEMFASQKKAKYGAVEITRSLTIISDLKALFFICKYIKKNDIDTVVGHTPKGALLAMIASYLMRVPKRIYFRHGLVFETMTGIKKLLMINLDRLTSFCSTKIISVSPSVSQLSLKHKLNNPQKQSVLGKGSCGGIDALNKFNPHKLNNDKRLSLRRSLNLSANCFVFGYCGRLVGDKGISELILAFEELSTFSTRHVKLLLIGDFEKRDALPDNIINKIETDTNIIKTGFLLDDIEYYYSMMNVFILPTYREGFPTSILEASSMEIPVLTTKVTGARDSIIDGTTGFFMENTKESILTHLISTMSNPNLIQIGQNGREHVLSYFDNHIIWPIIEKEIYKL